MRLYWGHTEPRITNLTLKIMGVNVCALIMLLLGVLYLGQYQNELIEAKLEIFSAKTKLIAGAVAETAITMPSQPAWENTNKKGNIAELSETKARKIVRRFGSITNQRIYIFNHKGKMIADSAKLGDPDGQINVTALPPPPLKNTKTSGPLKLMAKWVISLTPEKRSLPRFPYTSSQNVRHYKDALQALAGKHSISAWHSYKKTIILSAASPVGYNNKSIGAVMITREAHDIEEDIGSVWHNILLIFIGTLILTIFLSIYLSGVIARPLMRLAKAAERVRTDPGRKTEIPDLSNRYDEIGELSLALRDMTEALCERMDTIESFAADVSHELKNPLTSLRSATETLGLVQSQKDKDKLMEIIQHDLQRLDRLISDISRASRLDSELTRETLKRVDIHELLQELLEIHRDPLEREEKQNRNKTKINNVNLVLNLCSNKPIVPGIHSRLTQVFENLISNALSFSPPESTINITTRTENSNLHITVTDQGPGIPENKLDTIFKRFYSERPDHEDYGNNSGLGLSICKQIITALNGEIFAENIEQNKEIIGAQFTVILPTL